MATQTSHTMSTSPTNVKTARLSVESTTRISPRESTT